jgi:hypothetical protein
VPSGAATLPQSTPSTGGASWPPPAAALGPAAKPRASASIATASAPSPVPRPAPGGPSPAAASRPTTAGSRSLQAAAAPTWTIEQVGKWLGVLGLDRYATAFSQHEVSGGVLLDVTGEDLSYLGVSVLAHRKLLLRGIAQLKDAAAASGSVAAATAAASGESGLGAPLLPPPTDSSSSSSSTRALHWSHAPPLKVKGAAATDTSLDRTGAPYDISQGAAAGGQQAFDLGDGEYDEAAQASAFKAAVEAWRKAGPRGASGPGSGADTQPPAAAGGELWHNPFGGGLPSSEGPLAASQRLAKPGAGAASASGTQASGGESGDRGLGEGDLDEAAEAAAFREAVMAWRSGRQECADAPKPITGGDRSTSVSEGSGSEALQQQPKMPCYSCFKQFYTALGYFPSPSDCAGTAALSPQLHTMPFCSEACFMGARSAVLIGAARRHHEADDIADELARTEAAKEALEAELSALRAALAQEEEKAAAEAAAPGISAASDEPVENSGAARGSCSDAVCANDLESVVEAAALAAGAIVAEKSSRAAKGAVSGPVGHDAACTSTALSATPIDTSSVDFNALF